MNVAPTYGIYTHGDLLAGRTVANIYGFVFSSSDAMPDECLRAFAAGMWGASAPFHGTARENHERLRVEHPEANVVDVRVTRHDDTCLEFTFDEFEKWISLPWSIEVAP